MDEAMKLSGDLPDLILESKGAGRTKRILPH
jgi:hypothetical protein